MQLPSVLRNLSNFYGLEVAARVSETQLKVGENSNLITPFFTSSVVFSTAAFYAFYEFGIRFQVSAVWKKQKCFFSIHWSSSVLWGASVTERWRARPQTSRVWISNSVSGGQCHLTHLTILRRLSWPNLACMFTKWPKAWFILFHCIYLTRPRTSPPCCGWRRSQTPASWDFEPPPALLVGAACRRTCALGAPRASTPITRSAGNKTRHIICVYLFY